MSISGQQKINIGLPNESANSDSLYVAFNKIETNFDNLFSNAIPAPIAGNGINLSQTSNVLTISANLIAGNNVSLTNSNGAIIIEATGTGNGGAITEISPGTGLTGGGNIGVVTLGLANTTVTPGSYTNPNVVIDSTGRIISASNNTIAGTVTSVALAPGSGISVAGGPITSNGTITVTNTGVTRLNAGTGISVSSSNGNVTISATSSTSGTVTSVGVNSSQLVVTGSPILTSGTIGINLPNNVTFTGNVVSGNSNISGRLLFANSDNLSNGGAANINVTPTFFSTGVSNVAATLAAGSTGQIKTFMMSSDGGGDMSITVANAAWGGSNTMTFDSVGQGCTLQYVNNKWFCIGNNGVTFA